MSEHTELTAGRWHTMSLAEQLGNIGSEYERARTWRARHDERFEKAFERFLELLDLTIHDSRLTSARRRELLRLREIACSELTGAISSTLNTYFYHFALLARMRRS